MNLQPLKIGFDAKRAFLNKTGLGNYSRSAIYALAVYFPENEYYLYTPKVGTEISPDFLPDLNNTRTKLPAANLFKSFWRSKSIVKDLKRDGIQLYHGLSQELPFGIKNWDIKTVVTIHDLIYLKYPEYFSFINRKIYEWKARTACKNANLIIAVSEQTKADLVAAFNLSPQKIKVVYQGCGPIFRQQKNDAVKEAVKAKYQLPGKFILNVGTIETRKNLLLVAKALKNIPEEVSLVVVGRQTKYAKQVKNYLVKEALQNRVLFLTNVPFEDLTTIYQMAKVFVYPSRYEGFGIPIVEALCSGTPVIAATGSCLEEAGGPNSIYVDPDDAISLAKQINLILQDNQLQSKMKTKGLKYAKQFEEKNIAQNLMNVYQQALNYA
ncbi:glycosyltransferase family 4 protein [Mucilaginibacter arboris]|uniref:Glycosyltransferase n=1 Tax=Mucilaginibacter arboris TaxID=2682090 RepID=A0A7K1SVB6_9SPHI|nr:glycosyltransferase family 1 protein [Mucilaginibacter arboris]MVN20990.1 glycosyltransferase [Mucilaginibacter arboris]